MKIPSKKLTKNAGSDAPSPANGDNSVFAALFETHNAKLVKFLTIRLGDEQEAQDVAHEAYVRLLGLADDKVINYHRAYLYRTATNIAIDRIRAAKRRGAVSNSWHDEHENIASDAPYADEIIMSKETLTQLKNAIAELPPKCRYAFLEYRLKGRNYAEIAEELSVTESMIRKYVLKALRHCRAVLDAEN